MAKPALVANCVSAMQQAVSLPITVKTRIGIDQQDNYDLLYHFIKTVHEAGCDTFIIHARKAWLNGLNPKQNRAIPPLRYDVVYQLKRDFPQCCIIINGGITTVAAVQQHLTQVDGVMIGRAAYHKPYLLAELEAALWGTVALSREDIIHQLIPYVVEQTRNGIYHSRITRHILGLFTDQAGAKAWRRYLSQNGSKIGDTQDLLLNALMVRQQAAGISHERDC